MLQSSTPFAIRDENQGQTKASSVKPMMGLNTLGQQKRVGLVDSTPLKANGLNINSAKSTRKALGDLSSSQVNSRLGTPGNHGTATTKKIQFKEAAPTFPMGLGSTVKQPVATFQISSSSSSALAAPAVAPFVEASTEVDPYDVADMICSHVGKNEDAYDYVVRNAAKLKFTLSPPACHSMTDTEAWSDKLAEWRTTAANDDELFFAKGSECEFELPVIECDLPDDP